ncbi:unnamed protein product [Ceutorhynchus assimilis]|uniref:Uncharacterized protein n=1 Tax=Ceutorhynchus assimilis TaxID=467358 RepID=A0A9N9MCA7_9CUCU|nr:unnamed protein product [Ceutorhynchus assimilis]
MGVPILQPIGVPVDQPINVALEVPVDEFVDVELGIVEPIVQMPEEFVEYGEALINGHAVQVPYVEPEEAAAMNAQDEQEIWDAALDAAFDEYYDSGSENEDGHDSDEGRDLLEEEIVRPPERPSAPAPAARLESQLVNGIDESNIAGPSCRRSVNGPSAEVFSNFRQPRPTVPNGRAVFAGGRGVLARPFENGVLPSLPSLMIALEGISSIAASTSRRCANSGRPNLENAVITSPLAVRSQHESAAGDVEARDEANDSEVAIDGAAHDGAVADKAAVDEAANDDGAADDEAADDGAADDGAADDGAADDAQKADHIIIEMPEDTDDDDGDDAVLPVNDEQQIEIDNNSLEEMLLPPGGRAWYSNRKWLYLSLVCLGFSVMAAILILALTFLTAK